MEEIVEKFYKNKQKIKELEEEQEKYKKLLEKDLIENKGKIVTPIYTLKRKELKTERMNKKDCPPDVWEIYATRSTYISYDVLKNEISKKVKKENKK